MIRHPERSEGSDKILRRFTPQNDKRQQQSPVLSNGARLWYYSIFSVTSSAQAGVKPAASATRCEAMCDIAVP